MKCNHLVTTSIIKKRGTKALIQQGDLQNFVAFKRVEFAALTEVKGGLCFLPHRRETLVMKKTVP